MSEAHNQLMAMHHQVCFEHGDHPDEIDTPYSLGAAALRRATPTREQIMADERVQALVEALRELSALPKDGTQMEHHIRSQAATARNALLALTESP